MRLSLRMGLSSVFVTPVPAGSGIPSNGLTFKGLALTFQGQQLTLG